MLGRPRITPIDDVTATDAQRDALAPLGPMAELNIFRTLAVHPKLLRSWLPFGGRLLQGSTLDARIRELVILRTAARCGSDYEWGQHVGIGRDAGLSDDEILGCAASGPDASTVTSWSGVERCVLGAVDELVGERCMEEATWRALSEAGWSDAQLVELPMLVGHYAMLAGMLRSVGVETEGPLPMIGSVEPAP